MAARRRRVLVDIGGSSAEARREVQKVRDEVRRLGREEVEARIDVNERVALQKIERVKQRIDRLKGQEASIDVDIKLASAYAQLDRLNLRLDRLREKRVNIDVDVRRGSIETAVAGFRRLEATSNRVGSGIARSFRSVPLVGAFLGVALDGVRGLINGLAALPSLIAGIGQLFIGAFQTGADTIRGLAQGTVSFGSVLTSAVGGLISFAAAAGTAALSLAATAAVAGLLVIAVNAVLGAIIALTGALVALVASLTAAVAGLGALAVAFAAALGPAILVVIGLFTRFAAIIKARQAHEQELAQAVQAQKTAEQQRKDAVDASRQAHQRLAEATVEGNRAMQQSALDLRDAELGLSSWKLEVKEARLNLLDARKALKDFLHEAGASGPKLGELVKQFSNVEFNPASARGILAEAGGSTNDPLELQRRILAVQRAQQSVKESINQTAHAEQTLAQATRTRANFVRQGINAYKPYRQALEAVRKADERVTRAQEQSTAAQRKYERALKDLSTTERGTLSRLNELIKGFTSLAKAFTDPIFKALNQTFDSLKGSGDTFRQGLVELGKAFADVVRSIGGFLREPATLTAFKTMAAGAAELVRQLGAQAFVSFLRIMREVAVTALPAVVEGARKFSGWLARIAGQPGKIRDATSGLIGQFSTWANLAWQVLRAVVGIFRAAAGQGARLAKDTTTIVKNFADWANSRDGQERLRAFFARMVQRAKEIVRWIKDAAVWLRNNLPRAAATAKRAFEEWQPILDAVLATVRMIATDAKAINELVSDPFGRKRGNRGATFGESLPSIQADLGILRDRSQPRQRRVEAGQRVLERPEFQREVNKGTNALAKQIAQEIKRVLRELGATANASADPLSRIIRRATGGLVPGSGRGDTVPALLEPGEFVLKRSVVQKLSLPVLRAMNGGVVPHVSPAPVAAGGGFVYEQHNHITGSDPDPRHYAQKLSSEMGRAVEREVQRLGLVSP